MDLSVAIGSLMAAYDSKAADVTLGRLTVETLDLLESALAAHLHADLREQVQSRRIAFATPETLHYPSNVEQVTEHWLAQETVIIQSLQTREGILNRVAAVLQYKSGLKLSCSAYIAAPKAASFALHTDAWDALIVQLTGEKTFWCGAKDRLAIRLTPGAWILIPEGIPHAANTDTGSVHLSFNFIHRLAASE